MYIVGPHEITTNEIIELRKIFKRKELGHFLLRLKRLEDMVQKLF